MPDIILRASRHFPRLLQVAAIGEYLLYNDIMIAAIDFLFLSAMYSMANICDTLQLPPRVSGHRGRTSRQVDD